MDQIIFPEIPAEDREGVLRGHCEEIEEDYFYSRALTAEEITDINAELAEDAVELNRLQDKLKAITEEYKIKMKPIQDRVKTTVLRLQTKRIDEIGTVYKFVDFDAKEVGYYDRNGNLVETRRARSEELQTSIFTGRRPSLKKAE